MVYRQWQFVNELSFHHLRINHLFACPVAHQQPFLNKSIQLVEWPLLIMSCQPAIIGTGQTGMFSKILIDYSQTFLFTASFPMWTGERLPPPPSSVAGIPSVDHERWTSAPTCKGACHCRTICGWRCRLKDYPRDMGSVKNGVVKWKKRMPIEILGY